MKTTHLFGALLLAAIPFVSTPTPAAQSDSPTVIPLDEFDGYFAAREALAGLQPRRYRFVVRNKADKLVGFQLQNLKIGEALETFALEPGAERSTEVAITTDGFRYRCPINPTPWYEVSVQ